MNKINNLKFISEEVLMFLGSAQLEMNELKAEYKVADEKRRKYLTKKMEQLNVIRYHAAQFVYADKEYRK